MKSIILPSIILSIFLFTVNDTSFSQEPLKQFEDKNMGMRFSYPPYWTEEVGGSFAEKNGLLGCYGYYCHAVFMINENEPFDSSKYATVTVFTFDSEHLSFIEDCQCHTLTEFMRDSYNTTIKMYTDNSKRIILNNDNQTSVGENYTAWQLEYSIPTDNSKILQILMKSNNTFYYDISFVANSNEIYTAELPGFKQLLNSIEFIPVQKSKSPSFINE